MTATFCYVPFFHFSNHLATHFAEKRQKNGFAHFLYLVFFDQTRKVRYFFSNQWFLILAVVSLRLRFFVYSNSKGIDQLRNQLNALQINTHFIFYWMLIYSNNFYLFAGNARKLLIRQTYPKLMHTLWKKTHLEEKLWSVHSVELRLFNFSKLKGQNYIEKHSNCGGAL